MRRLSRILGTLLIAGGVLTLAWVVVVWRWEDPFTALYTHFKQAELTKTYEEVRRGGLGELAEWAREHARGEITIVIEGAPGTVVGIDEAAEMVAELTADGIKRSKAVAQVARATGVDRHDLYDAAQNALTTDKEES